MPPQSFYPKTGKKISTVKLNVGLFLIYYHAARWGKMSLCSTKYGQIHLKEKMGKKNRFRTNSINA